MGPQGESGVNLPLPELPPVGDVTCLLGAWQNGDSAALNRLTDLLYGQLRAMADRHMRRESVGHTLQATALVHEAYARVVGADLDFHDRSHFLAVMSTQMRRILIDHAKAKHRDKRGGHAVPISLDDVPTVAADSNPLLLDLDEIIQALGRRDPRKEKVLEMLYFGGMTQPEIAEALGISLATVERDLRMARAWVKAQLGDDVT